MNAFESKTLGHKFGAEAIEQRLTEIALLTRKAFPHCVWDHGRQASHPYTYRLIVQAEGREAPLEFTVRELLTYARRRRRSVIDHRMQDALDKLFDDT